jgi:erythrocyte band 7 integral membrane protein
LFVCKATLDEATDPWGVQVERVEVKDVRVPEQLQRAMAAEAEAAREARAKVIAAEGEHKASRALRHAAEVIMDCPAALQVHYFIFFNRKLPQKILILNQFCQFGSMLRNFRPFV